MAWSKAHKEQSKQRILQSAALLFTQQGFDKVSIDQVMQQAEMTRGAFYSHFSSKSDLYAQAIPKASQLAQQRISAQVQADLTSLAKSYLSPQHKDDTSKQACPLAFLISDINQNDQQVRATYSKTLERFVQQTQLLINDRSAALQSTVLMIGGLALARAIDNEALANELMQASQQGVEALSQSINGQ